AADPAAALPAFLKRNRDFFGRNMREVFLERMQEADFKESFRPASAQTIWALALVWSASFN
ncbi:MAG TPA: hypothetical protein PLP17_06450, partial [Oligoflexia bacterium]|nr:hypothetical protein [Oligoflexia bacterium]